MLGVALMAQRPDPVNDEELVTLARQVQDIIFLTRLRVSRVRDWFCMRFRGGDRADFQAVVDELMVTVRERKSGT